MEPRTMRVRPQIEAATGRLLLRVGVGAGGPGLLGILRVPKTDEKALRELLSEKEFRHVRRAQVERNALLEMYAEEAQVSLSEAQSRLHRYLNLCDRKAA